MLLFLLRLVPEHSWLFCPALEKVRFPFRPLFPFPPPFVGAVGAVIRIAAGFATCLLFRRRLSDRFHDIEAFLYHEVQELRVLFDATCHTVDLVEAGEGSEGYSMIAWLNGFAGERDWDG